MGKDDHQTVNRRMQTTSMRRGYGAHGCAISYEEAIDQLEREMLKVLRGTGVSKTGREV